MRRRTKLTYLVFILNVCYSCHSNTNEANNIVAFFATDKPILTIGNESESKKEGTYESIWSYIVDNKDNVYIADKSNLRVDKFDNHGDYLFSFGCKTHDAVNFPRWINNFAIDSKGNLIAYCIAKRKFLSFSSDGKKFTAIDFNPELKKVIIKKMKMDRKDNLLILGYSQSSGYQLLKYYLDTKEYTIIHTDSRRIRPSFTDLLPDFEFDDTGNIYLTDTIEYRIFKYSRQGQLIDTFFRKAEKYKIRARDFNILMYHNSIKRVPNYKDALQKLKGPSRFFPIIFGINIDGERIYVWLSQQDNEGKYLVDVYDLTFRHLSTTTYYNSLCQNLAFIKNGRLFIPNIENDDFDFKGSIGRFGVFNIPHKIEVFRISESILYD